MKVKLRIATPGKEPTHLELERDLVRIGRARACDLVVEDQKASGRHADLFTLDGQVFLRDLNSTNGVYVNGQRASEVPLHAGDAVRIGDTVITIERLEDDPPGAGRDPTARDVATIQDRFSLQVPLDDLEQRDTLLEATAETTLIRRKLRVLARLGKDLARLDTGETEAARLARLVRETIGPERLAILVPDGGRLVTSLSFDWRFPEPERPVHVPEAFLRTAISKSRALLNLDLLADPKYRDDPGIQAAPIHAAMAAPLLVGDEVRAAIYIDRAAAAPFTSEDLHTLAVIANQGAVILENARLFSDLGRSEEALAAKNKVLEATLEKLRLTQAELIQAAKLSSLGEFAAGITHELNNPLAGILGFAELVESDGGLPASALESLQVIRREAGRMKGIVQKIVSFARRDTGVTRQPVDVNDAIRAAIEILTPELRKRRVVDELDLAARAPVLGNTNELEQVVLNLVHNAAQALAKGPGKTVRLRTRAEGGTVFTTVSDDGPGIAAEHLPKIFDPFFTTKPIGVGTGLGLSVTYGIVSSHGGRISVSSEVGRGATFEIAIPESAAGAAPVTPAPPKPPAAGGCSILVVDDEKPVREILVRAFERTRHVARAFGDPIAALEALTRGEFDVVIADLRMPGLDGRELYRRTLEARPDLRGRFLFLTGSAASTEDPFFRDLASFVMLKPFEIGEVVRRVDEVAGGAGGAHRLSPRL